MGIFKRLISIMDSPSPLNNFRERARKRRVHREREREREREVEAKPHRHNWIQRRGERNERKKYIFSKVCLRPS